MQNTKTYDFIIAGTGCSGLSLAMQLKTSALDFKKVLLIDKDLKNKNDRTWCFWTKEKNSWFNSIVFKQWDKLSFKGTGLEKEFNLHPYRYCMIRGIDFYSYCMAELKNDPRFELVTDEITGLCSEKGYAVLTTKSNIYSGSYIFNSAFRKLDEKKAHINYVQHFKGWVIETEKDSFNEQCPVFMDFSPEQHNDCRFVYVIPYSPTKALVEYTGFSPQALEDEAYDKALGGYLKNNLKLSSYTVVETEKGEIPMAESEFINPWGARVINIGTAGGASKAGTGYTFYFIQKNTESLIAQIKRGTRPLLMPKRKKRYLYYDRILLSVIDERKIAAKDIFTLLFQKNPITKLLAFLNEESTPAEDLGILNSVPKGRFTIAAIKKLIN